jgi:predicted ATPase
VARIAAALQEYVAGCAVSGDNVGECKAPGDRDGGESSSARAAEIGALLADLFSLRWEDDRGLQIKNTDPEQRRHQTSLAIRDFLLALTRHQPLVLVLEDLHWADSLSLDLISLLLETLRQVPLLLLCSYRPDPEHRCSRLGTIAAQKCPESYTELRLRELTPLQNQQLVASLLGTRELPPPVKALVLDRSRGNPFFTEELVHSLVDRGVLYQEDGAWQILQEPARLQVPESVQSMILSRVDRLDPELKRLLQHASVIGRVFHRRLLAEVRGQGSGVRGQERNSDRTPNTEHRTPNTSPDRSPVGSGRARPHLPGTRCPGGGILLPARAPAGDGL